MTTEPSPEVKEMLRTFVQAQRAKYGDDWKEKLAAEMAEQAAPFVNALLDMRDAVERAKQ